MKKRIWMLLWCLLLACGCALAECSLCGGDSVCDACSGNGYLLMQVYGSDEEVKVVCSAGCDNGRCPDCAVPCEVCGSDGMCDTCGGKGYVLMQAYGSNEEVKVACPGESCAVGRCAACAQPEEPAVNEDGYSFADPAMEAVVRGLMGWEDRSITREDLLGITVLDTTEYDDWRALEKVCSLEDVARMENLTQLCLIGVPVSDGMLSSLSSLNSLEDLNLCEQHRVSDLSALEGLAELRSLSIAACFVSDLSPLSSLAKLEELYASYNEISDVSPLSNLTALRVLSLDGNLIEDVKPLAKLKNLEQLYLLENPVRNASALKGLKKLDELYID